MVAQTRRSALTTPTPCENPDARKSTPSATVLLELARPGGTALRLSVEAVAGRRVVRLAHLATTGAVVHAFTIEPSEARAVADALTEAARRRP